MPAQSRAYATGDIASTEISAPQKFSIPALEQTEKLRRDAVLKAPVVLRFQPHVSSNSIVQFNATFAARREKFLKTVEKNFKSPTLTAKQLASPRFEKFYTGYKAKNVLPYTLAEAKMWAAGDEEAEFRRSLEAAVSKAMNRLIRPEILPTNSVEVPFAILPANAPSERSAEDILRASQLIRRARVAPINRVKKNLVAEFPAEQNAVARFLMQFIEVNCVFDLEATSRLQLAQTNSILALETFEPGQVIVRRGDKINSQTKLALDALNIRIPVIARDPSGKILRWSVAGVLFALGLVLLWKTRKPQANSAENVLMLPQAEGEVLRTRLLPYLAKRLMNGFVRRLLSERSQLQETQDYGTQQLNQLEKRLEKISERLETKQSLYERRIEQLEKELAASEEENRELIRAKIVETRRNLEWARARNE